MPLYLLKDVKNKQVTAYTRGKDMNVSKKFDIRYIQALLSSRVMGFYFSEYLSDKLHVSPHQIRSLPIKRVDSVNQKVFSRIIDRIMNITEGINYQRNSAGQAKVKEYEEQIDQLVYKLYGLNDKEIDIIEDSFKK